MNGIDEEKTEKTEGKNGLSHELTPDYSGLSCEYTAEIGEPAPLLDDSKPPVHKTFATAEEIEVPQEAEKFDTAEKLRWFILIIFLAAPFVAGAVLLILGYRVPALICFGCFVVILPIFFIIYIAIERGAIAGKGVLNKPDTRKVTAQVVSCICVSRTYRHHNGRGVAPKIRILVGATYKTVVTDGRKNYTAKTKIYYSPRESVNAYVRNNRAYIDPNDAQNQR